MRPGHSEVKDQQTKILVDVYLDGTVNANLYFIRLAKPDAMPENNVFQGYNSCVTTMDFEFNLAFKPFIDYSYWSIEHETISTRIFKNISLDDWERIKKSGWADNVLKNYEHYYEDKDPYNIFPELHKEGKELCKFVLTKKYIANIIKNKKITSEKWYKSFIAASADKYFPIIYRASYTIDKIDKFRIDVHEAK